MLSTQKNGLLRALVSKNEPTSLNTRTLMVCVASLLALSLCIYAVLSKQFSAQHADQIDQLLKAKASLINQPQSTGLKQAVSMATVFYHQGNLAGAQATLDWPKGCQLISGTQGSAIQRFKCRETARFGDLVAAPTKHGAANYNLGHAQLQYVVYKHGD